MRSVLAAPATAIAFSLLLIVAIAGLLATGSQAVVRPASHGYYALPVVTFSVTSGARQTAEITVDDRSAGFTDTLTYRTGSSSRTVTVQPGTRRSARFRVPSGSSVSYCTSVQPFKGGVTESGPSGYWS